MTLQGTPDVLWRPESPEETSISKYRHHINQKFGKKFSNTHELVQWSCDSPQDFWLDLYSYLRLVPELPAGTTRAYDDSRPISSNPPFFEGLEINYAENALFPNPNPNPEAVALIGLREDQELAGEAPEIVTWRDFRDRVKTAASALRSHGIRKGDRVAALVATSVHVMVLFHAAASIGAIFTSINPDLGLDGCVARLEQVEPAILFADNATIYKGKVTSIEDKIDSIAGSLPGNIPIFVIPISDERSEYSTISMFLSMGNPSEHMAFTRVSFNDPLFICYSSGTTGPPKCIVHRHGLILQLKKVSTIHNTLTPRDIILSYSSTSWIVFYIMCGHLSIGATTICYNGSPLYPRPSHLLSLAAKYKVTYFGTSPRYLFEVETAGCVPKDDFDLSNLRLVYTTGSTMSAEQYRWFHRAFPSKVQICNTAGGTDTSTSLIALDAAGPVHVGEMQVCALGMDVDILDPITGQSIKHTGRAGEMVILKPFPSMPCYFWGDTNGSVYKSSYFERYDNIDVWAQHDWLAYNPNTGGFVMSGRSDGVLNPSGIRFGSSEIYSIVESAPYTDVIVNSLCVGRRRPQDRDEEVFLFVVLKKSYALTNDMRDALKKAIREALSPRHVPRYILQVPEIPVTINGKKIEIAVKQTLSGRDVVPSATVLNPDSIAYFRRFRDLDKEPKDARL